MPLFTSYLEQKQGTPRSIYVPVNQDYFQEFPDELEAPSIQLRLTPEILLEFSQQQTNLYEMIPVSDSENKNVSDSENKNGFVIRMKDKAMKAMQEMIFALAQKAIIGSKGLFPDGHSSEGILLKLHTDMNFFMWFQEELMGLMKSESQRWLVQEKNSEGMSVGFKADAPPIVKPV